MHAYTYSPHFQHSVDQPGMIVNLARGHLKRENDLLPVPVRARKFFLAIRMGSAVPSLTSLLIMRTLRLNRVLTHGILNFLSLSATASTCTVNRHRLSPEFIESRKCVSHLC